MVKNRYPSIRKMEKILVKKKLRITPQRLQIAVRVLSKHHHFTADEIVAWSSKLKFKLSRATIYNTLNDFVSAGLLKSFYSITIDKLIFDSNTSQHFHFVDKLTNKISDIDPSIFKIKKNALIGYKVDDTEVVLRGRKL
jgi:Fur family iron response transcriptional regulator